LRQAYDYWQDQPGNYYPHCPDTNDTKGHFHRWEFIKLAEVSVAA